MDDVLIAIQRDWTRRFDRYFGIFPADAGAVTIPFTSLGFSSSWIRPIVALAVDLPDDAEGGFGPKRLFG